jgi:hypothetical protein
LNNDEKDKDKFIFKDIKRYEIIKKPKEWKKKFAFNY